MTDTAAPMDAWLHPAVQSALVTALVVLLGWRVSAMQSRSRDQILRSERVADTQRALLAEIRANFASFDTDALEQAAAMVRLQVSQGRRPLLPTERNDKVFQAVIHDIPILPSGVIDPVILYYRQLSVISALAQDFRALKPKDADRAIDMIEDYLALHDFAVALAGDAIEALRLSLDEGEDGLKRRRRSAQDEETRRIRAELPGELDEMRRRLNTPASARSDP